MMFLCFMLFMFFCVRCYFMFFFFVCSCSIVGTTLCYHASDLGAIPMEVISTVLQISLCCWSNSIFHLSKVGKWVKVILGLTPSHWQWGLCPSTIIGGMTFGKVPMIPCLLVSPKLIGHWNLKVKVFTVFYIYYLRLSF